MDALELKMTSVTGQLDVRRGFTLIELCLVLTLLAVAAALIAPALSNFMRSRTLDAEARRMLSLTRAAQSRAVSEGLPVLLWFDAEQASYGMEEETRTEAIDPQAMQFTLNDRLRLTVMNPSPSATQKHHLPAMRFLPDGSVDETSPAAVQLSDASGPALLLQQTRSRMSYEIQYAN